MNWWITAFLLTIVFLTSGHNFTCVPSVEVLLRRKLRPHWRGESAFGLLLLVSLISLPKIESIPLGYHDLFFYAGMCWLVLAFTWADDRLRSLRRTIQFGIAAFAALVLASAFDFKERVSIVALCSGMFLLLELIDGAFQGRVVDAITRRFGRTVLPNRQAYNALLLSLCIVYFMEANELSLLVGFGLIVPVLVLLLLTQARAATWAGLISYVVWLLASLWQGPENVSRVVLAMPLVYLAMIAIVFSFLVPKHPKSNRVQAVVHLGRKASELKDLNQRKPLWIYTLKMARKRWIAGHGYGSFWLPSRSQEAASWHPANAHSCYLDVFASTGIVGLILFVGFFAGLVITALGSTSPEMQFVLSLTCYATLLAGMESKFWLGDYDTFSFLVIVLNLPSYGVQV